MKKSKGKANEYNVSRFINDVIKREIKVGLVLTTDMRAVILNEDTKINLKTMQQLVGGYIEPVGYASNEEYDIIVDEEGICKGKKLNITALVATGYQFYGDVLILRKGLLK